jgi:low affinity Fe/Cu permease
MRISFRQFASHAATAMGSPIAFGGAVAFVVVWAVAGPYYRFSDGWQLVANTITTILTFLVVFLVQATQNRDAKATSIKLDELLRAVEGARTGFANLDALSDEDLSRVEAELRKLGRYEGICALGASRAPATPKSDRDRQVASGVGSHGSSNLGRAMNDDTSQLETQNRALINMDQEHEVGYWARKFGVSRDDLQRAVDQAGPLADAVEQRLRGSLRTARS